MIDAISIWLGKRRQAKREAQMAAGYAWAAERLLRSRSWEDVRRYRMLMRHGPRTAFDEGIEQATRDWGAIEEAVWRLYKETRKEQKTNTRTVMVDRDSLHVLFDAMLPF